MASFPLLKIQVGGEVLRDEPIEEHSEDVALEVPAIHAAAQVICNSPDGFMELGALAFLGRAQVRAPFVRPRDTRLRSSGRREPRRGRHGGTCSVLDMMGA